MSLVFALLAAASGRSVTYNDTRIGYVHMKTDETVHLEFPIPNTIVIFMNIDKISGTLSIGNQTMHEFGTLTPTGDAIGAFFGPHFGRIRVHADVNVTLVIFILVSIEPCDVIFLTTFKTDSWVAGGRDGNWTESGPDQRACLFHAHPGVREYFASYAHLDDKDEVVEFSPTRTPVLLRDKPLSPGRTTGDWMLYIYHPAKPKANRYFSVHVYPRYRERDFYDIQARFPRGAGPTLLTRSMRIEKEAEEGKTPEEIPAGWWRGEAFGKCAVSSLVFFGTVIIWALIAGRPAPLPKRDEMSQPGGHAPGWF